jgi:DNA-binding LacI/PurR family transcriptional regulator
MDSGTGRKKRATMRDIAASLGVSVNAVSLALNDRKGVSEETRLKVLKAADKLGYIDRSSRFARSFEGHHLCALMQEKYASDMSFYGGILSSVINEAHRWGYDVVLKYFDDKNMEVPDCVRKRRVSGILVLGYISSINIEKLADFGIQTVLLDHAPRILKDVSTAEDAVSPPCILTDNVAGGFTAAQYLLDCGFTRIGFFGELFYTNSMRERYYGFREALSRAGIISHSESDDYIRRYSLITRMERYSPDMDTSAISTRLRDMLKNKKELPEAYFCCNDAAAIMMLNALNSVGLQIPRDISLIGFDNIQLSERISPALTTMAVDRQLMGEKGVQRLLRMLDAPEEKPEHTVLGVHLIVRKSVLPKKRVTKNKNVL